MNTFLTWYKISSLILGVPSLFFLLAYFIQKIIFTGLCMGAGRGCDYALFIF